VELRDPRTPAVSDAGERPFAERAREVLTGGDRVPAAVAPPAGHPRFPLIDGVRAIAALAIVATHSAFSSDAVNGGFYPFLVRLDAGVPIFFVVAGFLLFRPYFAEHVDGVRAPRFERYLFRRGLRVLPAYWLALTVLVVTGLITLDSRWWEHYGLVQIYDAPEVLSGIHPAWSLATEVSFYALLPVLVMLMRSERADTRAGRLQAGAWMAVALWVGTTAFRLSFRGLNHGASSVWFNALPGTLDWFALGIGLAVLSVWLAGSARRPKIVVLLEEEPGMSWLGALALFVFVSVGLGASGRWGLTHTTLEWFLMHLLYGAIAVLVVAPAVFPGEGKGVVHRVLGHPIMAGLGLISYGIFLYNGPFVGWVSRWSLLSGRPFVAVLVVTLAITIPAAALSYRFLERPLLRLKDWRSFPRPARVRGTRGEAERPVV
jgi:peptidoglycan/LPS O-acetylase OafA/YrhL